jgi:endonuclease I
VFEYYASVDFNKTGNNLKLELYNKIKGHVSTSYNGLNATMAITDRNWDLSPDPNDSNPYMVLIYASYNDTNPKKYSTRSNDVWDKEHIWAKSHGNFGNTPPAGSDMHHLRASDKSNNHSRGNLDFGKANSVKSTINDYDGKPSGKTGTQTGKSGTVYEPLPQYRGDVARAMFYMATRYHNDTQTQLTLVDNTTSSSTGAGKFGILSTLLEWHLQDPVDEFEFRRNGLVQGYQNNRNPYIDFPSLAHDVFG